MAGLGVLGAVVAPTKEDAIWELSVSALIAEVAFATETLLQEVSVSAHSPAVAHATEAAVHECGVVLGFNIPASISKGTSLY